MPTTTQRVEGFQIIAKDGNAETIIGADGLEESWPAFSEQSAIAYVVLTRLPGVIYEYRQILEARYVSLLTGQIVDNGPKKPHSSS